MEFRYRAVDERSRSPPPPAAPSTPGSGSADGHGSDGPAERVSNSAVTLWRPELPPPETAAAVAAADELRRQAEKARIRERILREGAEHLELELEVRRELWEQMLQLSWPTLGARGSGTAAAAPPGMAVNSSLPVVAHEVKEIHLPDGHNNNIDGPTKSVGNSDVTLWRPDLPPLETAEAIDSDKLRRQAEKARIRERILREEAEHLELEIEVRKELREQLQQLSWPVLGGPARGSATPAVVPPGTITAANSSLPVVALEAHPKASALATTLTKRKSPDRAAKASTLSLAPSSKKKRSTSTTCTVCGITANSEKAMQDHLNGKAHRKVVALSELPKQVPDEIEQQRESEAEEEEAMAMETLGDYKPTKFMMLTAGGALNEVTQMDGYLLCELCNVRTADRVTMMCHLQGSKHISNDQKKQQPSSKPSVAAIPSADPNKKQVLEDYIVPLPHNVRRLEGFIHYQLCDVKTPSMNGMRQHLSGKKHKNKANTSSDAYVNISSGGKEEVKAQPIDTYHTAVISDMAANVEAPPAKKLGDDSELQEMTVASPKEDILTGDNNKVPGTEMMKSSATSVGAELNNVCGSDSLTMEVDNVMHPLRRVDGLLVCLCCNAKAASKIIMQSHLAGKKHKRKMTLAGARGNNDLSIFATGADHNISKSTKGNVEAESTAPQAKTVANKEAESTPLLAVSQMKNTIAMASMAVDRPVQDQLATSTIEPAEEGEITEHAQLATCTIEPAEEGEITEEAEEEHATADSNNGFVIQAKESVITNNTTARVKPIKIQVEAKLFTVTQQENGRLSCELCGIHGCDKDSMIMHLYTSTHWGKANLAEKKEKEQACMAAAATVDKDGSGVTTTMSV